MASQSQSSAKRTASRCFHRVPRPRAHVCWGGVQFNEDGTIDHVEKLLNDGILKDLVEEGAFKGAFPEKE